MAAIDPKLRRDSRTTVPVVVELTKEAFDQPEPLPGFRCIHRLELACALVGELELAELDRVAAVPGVVRVELDTEASAWDPR